MSVKTRFAPSPTGYFHVGSARTALYAYLYARHFKGEFILRIEDTDRERSTDEATQIILDGMKWLGLEHDGEIPFQTKRFDRYQAVAEQLLEEGKAYRCYCSKERLTQLRETQMANKQKPRYDGHCRHLTETQSGSYVIRFKNPEQGSVIFDDLVRGEIEIQNSELDDLIIARSDGTPTYNFTVVVDDWDMQVSHVIRGEDHINNTPRQINIFKALNAEVPVYGHLPMLHGKDGKKLSKRHGAVSVLEYQKEGILPEALLNYLVRLGWSHGDQEIFSKQEMVEFFDGSALNNSAAVFNDEKLLWLNQHYIKTLPTDVVAEQLKVQLESLGVSTIDGPALTEVVAAQAERAKTIKEMAEKSRYFFEDVTGYDEKAAKKNLQPDTAAVFQLLIEKFSALEAWQTESIHQVVLDTAEQLDLKLGIVAQPIRVAVTGNTVSPSIDVTLSILGKAKTLDRLARALAFCQNSR